MFPETRPLEPSGKSQPLSVPSGSIATPHSEMLAHGLTGLNLRAGREGERGGEARERRGKVENDRERDKWRQRGLDGERDRWEEMGRIGWREQ